MGEGRQALDVNPEQARERVGLGVTELWELGSDMLHRAMPLAQLHAGHGCARSDRPRGRGETVDGQCCRQRLGARGDVITGFDDVNRVARFDLGASFLGEVAHGILTGVFSEEAQRRGGDVVAVAAHAGVTRLGQDVCPGGPTTTAAVPTSGCRLMFLDGALFGQEVEVTTDSCGSQPQTRCEGRCRDGAEL